MIPVGSFVTSHESLSQQLGLSKQQIRTAIKHLKSTNNITTKSTNKYTIINVVDWDKYQFDDNQINTQNNIQINKRATNEQQTSNKRATTSKEVKKERSKEVKNKEVKKTTSFNKPTVDEIKSYCNERDNAIDPQHFYDFYESKNWMIGKNKMKDWKAAVRTWERRNNNKPTSYFKKEKEDVNIDWLPEYQS
jgi:biotin operon repressor